MTNSMTKIGKIPDFEGFARPTLAKTRAFPVKSFTVEINHHFLMRNLRVLFSFSGRKKI